MPHPAKATRPGSQPALVVHIGLPKTATTFLQHSIFKWIENATYVHRRYDDSTRSIVRGLKRVPRVNALALYGVRRELREDLNRVLAASEAQVAVLVSDENISIEASEFWHGRGPSPDVFAKRFGSWARRSGLKFSSVKVILGIRRQDQWLASRYAQSAVRFPEFCQADFERRLHALCGTTLRGPLQWIDYDAVHRCLARYFRADNVFFMPMEALRHSPEATLAEMGQFFNGVDLVDIYQRKVVQEKAARSPSLSVAPNVWRLRKRDEQITLSDELARKLLDRFSESNKALAQATGLDLQAMGYY